MGLFSKKPKKETPPPPPAPAREEASPAEEVVVDLEAADLETTTGKNRLAGPAVEDLSLDLDLNDRTAESKLDIDELTDDLHPVDPAPDKGTGPQAAEPGLALGNDSASPEDRTVATEVTGNGDGLDLSGLDVPAEAPVAPAAQVAPEAAAPGQPEKPRLLSPEGKMLCSCSQCGVEYYLLPELTGREALCVRCRKVFIIDFGATPPYDTLREDELPPDARVPAAAVAPSIAAAAASTPDFAPEAATESASTALDDTPQAVLADALPEPEVTTKDGPEGELVLDLGAPGPSAGAGDGLALDLDLSAPPLEDGTRTSEALDGDTTPVDDFPEPPETETSSSILETTDPGLHLDIPEDTERQLILDETLPVEAQSSPVAAAHPPAPPALAPQDEFLDDEDLLEATPEFEHVETAMKDGAAPAPAPAAVTAADPDDLQLVDDLPVAADVELDLALDDEPAVPAPPPSRAPVAAITAPTPAPAKAADADDDLGLDLDSLPDIDDAPPAPVAAKAAPVAPAPAAKQAKPAPAAKEPDELDIDLDLAAPAAPAQDAREEDLADLELDLDDAPAKPLPPAPKAAPAAKPAASRAMPALKPKAAAKPVAKPKTKLSLKLKKEP